jgi:DUF971 family protein
LFDRRALLDLALNHDEKWSAYLAKLETAGLGRDLQPVDSEG